MRKYVQLVAVLAAFTSAVLIRQFRDAGSVPASATLPVDRSRPATTGPGVLASPPTPVWFEVPLPEASPPATPAPAPTATLVPQPTFQFQRVPLPTTTPTPIPAPTAIPAATASPETTPTPVLRLVRKPTYFDNAVFKDGVHTGKAVYTRYGVMRVSVELRDGRIVSVRALETPQSTATSVEMSDELVPRWLEQAVEIGDWDVDKVSGATITWQGFQKAMVLALREADQK